MKKHIVLLGDSIFDNAPYVPGEDPVIEQLRQEMPAEWCATLLATDGDVIADVFPQLERLPADATDVVISVGGNDVLQHANVIDRAASAQDLWGSLNTVVPRFRSDYTSMLDEALRYRRTTIVCTIYDQCPFPQAKWRELVPLALNPFNDCIVDEAQRRDIAVIDLRDVCTGAEDYSQLSPIEPSSIGGIKIACQIVRALSNRTGDA